jgi:hypothetical protein
MRIMLRDMIEDTVALLAWSMALQLAVRLAKYATSASSLSVAPLITAAPVSELDC